MNSRKETSPFLVTRIFIILVFLGLVLFYLTYEKVEYVCAYSGSLKEEVHVLYVFQHETSYNKSCLEEAADYYNLALKEQKWIKTSAQKLSFFGKKRRGAHSKAPKTYQLIAVNEDLTNIFSRSEIEELIDDIKYGSREERQKIITSIIARLN